MTYVTYRLSKQPVFNLEYGNVRGELEKRGGEVALENVRKVIIAVREAKLPDPRVQGNAGSFFMNPIVPRRQFEIVQQQYPDNATYEVDGNRGEDSCCMDDRPLRLERQTNRARGCSF